jgi:hypothetical protein
MLEQLTATQWQASRHRCSCGFAAADMTAFDRHLEATDGLEPEHFEVLDGWTLPQVVAWQAGPGTNRPARARYGWAGSARDVTAGGELPFPALTAGEQAAVAAARVSRQLCLCGGACHADTLPLTAELAGRLRRYLAEHPDHRFFHDDEGNVAVVVGWNPDRPDVRAAPDLESLLDELDAGPVADLS